MRGGRGKAEGRGGGGREGGGDMTNGALPNEFREAAAAVAT